MISLDKNQKIKFCLRIFIIALVLFIITTLLYMHYFYKPIQLTEVYEVDEKIKKLNKDILKGSVSLILIISSMISFLFVISYEFILLRTKTPIRVRAELKRKEIMNNVGINPQLGISFNTRYALTFVLENNKEKIFYVRPKQYAPILDGNKGVLTYNENLMKRFISFYVEEIE